MGRDLWLPKQISRIHPERRTPQVAIVTTGVILIILAVTLPIETVGSAASLMFLLTFAMVNLSVIALRRKYPELPRKYKLPLYPVVPVLGFGLNVFLALYQFNFQPIAWYITIGWVAVGLLFYYAIFEKRAAVLEPQVLLPRQGVLEAEEGPCVLVALHNPDNVEALMRLARAVGIQRGIRIVAITVVEVPRQVPIHEGMRFAHHREPLLEQARELVAKWDDVALDTDLIIAHHAQQGILASVDQHRAEALVMGWKGFTNASDRIFGEIADSVIRLVTADLLLLKTDHTDTFRTCLLPTAGGPNARLAATVLAALAKQESLAVTAAYVVPRDATVEDREAAEARIDHTLERWQNGERPEKLLIEARSVAGGIARASRDFDLVVIGAAKEPWFRKMLFGEVPEKVARYSPSAVLLVKKYEGLVKSLLKRIFG